MRIENRKIAFLILFSFLALFTSISLIHFEKNKTVLTAKETPEMTATYTLENETVSLTVVNGRFTTKSGYVKISKKYASVENKTQPFTLKADGKTKKTRYWAKTTLLGILPTGLTKFPIKQGEKIHITKDGTDKDNDGKKGIEKNDVIVLYSKDENVDAPIARYWPSKDKRYYK